MYYVLCVMGYLPSPIYLLGSDSPRAGNCLVANKCLGRLRLVQLCDQNRWGRAVALGRP